LIDERVSSSLGDSFYHCINTMSGEPVPIAPARNVALDTSSFTSSSSPSLWDRLSTWASENKAAVYTIAGVAVVVTGAGVVYYLSDSRRGPRPAESSAAEEKKKQSKKDRRKAKKQAEEAKKEVTPKSDTEPGTLAYLCLRQTADKASRGGCDSGNGRRIASSRRVNRRKSFRAGKSDVDKRLALC